MKRPWTKSARSRGKRPLALRRGRSRGDPRGTPRGLRKTLPGSSLSAFAHLAAAQQQRPSLGPHSALAGPPLRSIGPDGSGHRQLPQGVDAGEIDPAAVRRGFELLYSRQRYAEADAMLHRLEERQVVLLPGTWGAWPRKSPCGWRTPIAPWRSPARWPQQSKDWADHLWLGEVASFAGQRAEANQKPKEARDYFREARKGLS